MPDHSSSDSDVPEEYADSKPGERSGTGAHSLWPHLAQDAQRKSVSGQQPNAQVKPERSKHSVLVVDDQPAGRYALGRALRAAGYDTLVAAGGAEALLLAGQASAVVLDVDLPDVHGLEVCRLLRSSPATEALPIVHISAVYVEEHDKAAGQNAGADDYLRAPVSTEHLVALLDGLIANAAATSSSKARARKI
ncbi:MAG: hybrid sensor histidine kinase/response regulator [Ramlibacter sp.]|nr:hybrid sensor histidine kinase/response regulator [Ramlibacter sp.]